MLEDGVDFLRVHGTEISGYDAEGIFDITHQFRLMHGQWYYQYRVLHWIIITALSPEAHAYLAPYERAYYFD